jgi:hypothetical protein
MKRVAAVICSALFALLGSGLATAGLFRAYLSVNGNDANPCTVQQPCRLLPAALAAVDDGGEVWILDTANFNTGKVSVTRPATIIAAPGALASLVALNGSVALSVNVTSTGGSVTLRNVTMRGFGDVTNAGVGIYLQNGSLRVEKCEFFDFNTGVDTGGNTKMTIVDTSMHDVGTGVAILGAAHGSIDRLSVSNSTYGIQAFDGARVTVSNSTFSENGAAIAARATSGSGTIVHVARSTITATARGEAGFEIEVNAGLVAQALVHSSTIHVDVGFRFLNASGSGNALAFSYGDNGLTTYTAVTQGNGSLAVIPAN